MLMRRIYVCDGCKGEVATIKMLENAKSQLDATRTRVVVCAPSYQDKLCSSISRKTCIFLLVSVD